VSWAEQVRIETPEQIDFDFEMAGPGSRAAAQLLDWLVKFIWLALGALLTVVAQLLAGGDSPFLTYMIAGGALLLGFIFFVGYDIFYEGFREGQTPGKKYIGIRVVRDGGGPIDVRAAAIRNLVNIADFLPLGYLLGGVICLLNARGQRLGDMAAGTLVIRHQEVVKPPVVPAAQLSSQNQHQFTKEELSRLTAQDRHVLESYFQRAHTLDERSRERLTARLYQTYGDRLQRSGAVVANLNEEEAFDFLLALLQALKINSDL